MQRNSVRLQTFLALAALGLFAVPTWAQQFSERGERSSRPTLGVAVEHTADHAQHEGLVVQQVMPGSPAERAGLRQGDVITRIDSRPVEDHETLVNVLSRHQVGDRLDLQIMRNGQNRTMQVTLGERGSSRQGSEQYGSERSSQQEQYTSQRSGQQDQYGSQRSGQQDQYGSQQRSGQQDQYGSQRSGQQDQYGSQRSGQQEQ